MRLPCPSSDLAAATALAAQMVWSYGMGGSLISYEAVSHGPHSPNLVAKVLTNEAARTRVEELLSSERAEVGRMLIANRDLVVGLRDALLEKEELLGDDILAVIDGVKTARSAG